MSAGRVVWMRLLYPGFDHHAPAARQPGEVVDLAAVRTVCGMPAGSGTRLPAALAAARYDSPPCRGCHPQTSATPTAEQPTLLDPPGVGTPDPASTTARHTDSPARRDLYSRRAG